MKNNTYDRMRRIAWKNSINESATQVSDVGYTKRNGIIDANKLEEENDNIEIDPSLDEPLEKVSDIVSEYGDKIVIDEETSSSDMEDMDEEDIEILKEESDNIKDDEDINEAMDYISGYRGDVIVDFNEGSMMLERLVKTVEGGKLVEKKVRSKKKKLSSKQKSALNKARNKKKGKKRKGKKRKVESSKLSRSKKTKKLRESLEASRPVIEVITDALTKLGYSIDTAKLAKKGCLLVVSGTGEDILTSDIEDIVANECSIDIKIVDVKNYEEYTILVVEVPQGEDKSPKNESSNRRRRRRKSIMEELDNIATEEYLDESDDEYEDEYEDDMDESEDCLDEEEELIEAELEEIIQESASRARRNSRRKKTNNKKRKYRR